MLEDAVTLAQVKNYWWNQAWEKYKAVRQLQNHTGEGDGDEESIPNSTGETGSDSNSEAGDTEQTVAVIDGENGKAMPVPLEESNKFS